MLNDAAGLKKIYLAAGYTDLRRGIDGLATMIRFRFLLLYKRLDNGAFSWPRSVEEALEISSEQYAMLMQGLEIIPKHPIRPNDNPKRMM